MLISLISLVQINIINCWEVDYNWYYSQPPAVITICQTNDINQMRWTLLHELWHFFFHQYLNDEEKEIWAILSQSSYINDYISVISMINTNEDFAETFKNIYLKNKELNRFKKAYMNYLINKYLWKK